MMKGRLTLLLIVILVPCLAMAHSLRPVYVVVSFESETTVLLELQRPLLDGKLVDVSLTLNCERTTPVESQWTSAGMIDRWQADCGAAGLEHMVFAGLIPEAPNAIVTLFSLDGEKQTYVVDSGSASLTLKSEAPGLPAYLWLGVEHLLLGFDHVLLVLGLMLLISNRWVLIQAVTSFTVAHSVTLALSSLSIIELPQASVEAVIALTLLYLAVEIASPERHQSLVSRYPWIIAFAFGLTFIIPLRA